MKLEDEIRISIIESVDKLLQFKRNWRGREKLQISISNRFILHNCLANPHLPFPSSIQFEHRPTKKFSFSIDELARGAADNELKARRLSYRELVTEKSIGYEKRSMKIAAACQTSTVAPRGKGHRLSSVSIKFPSSTAEPFQKGSGNPSLPLHRRTAVPVPSIFRSRTVWQRFEETLSRFLLYEAKEGIGYTGIGGPVTITLRLRFEWLASGTITLWTQLECTQTWRR